MKVFTVTKSWPSGPIVGTRFYVYDDFNGQGHVVYNSLQIKYADLTEYGSVDDENNAVYVLNDGIDSDTYEEEDDDESLHSPVIKKEGSERVVEYDYASFTNKESAYKFYRFLNNIRKDDFNPVFGDMFKRGFAVDCDLKTKALFLDLFEALKDRPVEIKEDNR